MVANAEQRRDGRQNLFWWPEILLKGGELEYCDFVCACGAPDTLHLVAYMSN